MQRLAELFSRRRRYDDLAVSIQEHIAERAEELMESGMPRVEAEQAARREFGNVGLIEQRSREEWQWLKAESIVADVRFALRMILTHRWFSAAVVATLALGIGLNTMVFTLVSAVLFRPVPVPGGARLVSIVSRKPCAGRSLLADVVSRLSGLPRPGNVL